MTRHCRLLALAFLLIFVGCMGMGKFDLDVTLDHASFQAKLNTVPSVEVNFVGVNASEFPVWNNYSTNKYWMPDDSQRVTAVRAAHCQVMTFDENPPFRKVVSRSAPIWSKWKSKNAAYLFAIVNYPRTGNDLPGNSDVRRVVLPLERTRWKGYFWGRRRILFEVKPSGIDCFTPPMPPRPPSR